MRLIALPLLILTAGALAEPAVPPPRVLPKLAFTQADFDAQTQRSPSGDYLMEVPQIANLSLSAIARSVLAAKSIETVAQFTQADGKPRIVRSLISCCAIHAKQYEVAVSLGSNLPVPGEMEWVKLQGTIAFRSENGAMTPTIIVRELAAVPTPGNPILK